MLIPIPIPIPILTPIIAADTSHTGTELTLRPYVKPPTPSFHTGGPKEGISTHGGVHFFDVPHTPVSGGDALGVVHAW